MIDYPLPLIGFAAFSGTGKTTLLSRLIPMLKADGLRIGVVKHAHHRFDIDHPGKDSHTLRCAGAEQMLIASRGRIAWVQEQPEAETEPTLEEVLGQIDPSRLDLVLVEGFKRERFPKIELHRPALGEPLLCAEDPTIVAVASDTPLVVPPGVVQLDLNRVDSIAGFLRQWLRRQAGPGNRSASVRLMG